MSVWPASQRSRLSRTANMKRRRDGESDPEVAEVGGPHPLASEGDSTAHDQHRADQQREAERLVEDHERNRDRRERSNSHHDRRPRCAGFADRLREEELRDARARSLPPRGTARARTASKAVTRARGEADRGRQHERDGHGDERAELRVVDAAQPEPDRDRQRAEERRRRARQQDAVKLVPCPVLPQPFWVASTNRKPACIAGQGTTPAGASRRTPSRPRWCGACTA